MIKLLLVDDHAIVRQGLIFYFRTQNDFEIAGEAAGGEEACEMAAKLGPDVILMDLIMQGMDGIEATRRLKERMPGVKVVVLTTFADQDHVIPAIRAGASGFVLKDAQPEQLAQAVREVHAGRSFLDPRAAGQLMAHVAEEDNAAEPGAEALTPRETEVLLAIAAGRSNKEIAAELGIAEKTVKTHVSAVLAKLNLADRTQAALYAVKKGIAPL